MSKHKNGRRPSLQDHEDQVQREREREREREGEREREKESARERERGGARESPKHSRRTFFKQTIKLSYLPYIRAFSLKKF